MLAFRTFRLNRRAISVAVGIAIFSLGVIIEGSLHAMNIQGFWEWADNCISALAAGMIIYYYEQRQYKKDLSRLRVIAEMNHHIRNALQPMIYLTGEAMPREQQLKLIRNSVDRIQWALTDILPGDAAAPRTGNWPPKQGAPGDAA